MYACLNKHLLRIGKIIFHSYLTFHLLSNGSISFGALISRSGLEKSYSGEEESVLANLSCIMPPSHLKQNVWVYYTIIIHVEFLQSESTDTPKCPFLATYIQGSLLLWPQAWHPSWISPSALSWNLGRCMPGCPQYKGPALMKGVHTDGQWSMTKASGFG